MSTLDSWSLVVTRVFNIKGRGRVVVGEYVGTTCPKRNDMFATPDGRTVRVLGVEGTMRWGRIDRNVGLLVLAEIPIERGMHLRQVEPEDV